MATSGSAWTGLRQVVLDGIDVAYLSFLWVESRSSARSTLTQEVPALIKLELDSSKSLSLFVGNRSLALEFSQLVLFVGQLLNRAEDIGITHVVSPAIVGSPGGDGHQLNASLSDLARARRKRTPCSGCQGASALSAERLSAVDSPHDDPSFDRFDEDVIGIAVH